MCRNHSHMVVESLRVVGSSDGAMLEVMVVQPLTLEAQNGSKLTFSPGLRLLLPSLSMAGLLRSVGLATGEQYAFSSPEDVIAFASTVIQPRK